MSRTSHHILDMTTRDGALVSASCTCGHPYITARTIEAARDCHREHLESFRIAAYREASNG